MNFFFIESWSNEVFVLKLKIKNIFISKKIAEKTLNLVKSIGFSGESLTEKADIENIRNFLKEKSNGSTFYAYVSKNLDSLFAIFHHKELARRQRISYQSMKNNLAEDYLFIDIDYKQKVN